MKSCKKKFILLLVSLLTCATVFTFVGCADGETADDINNNGQSTGDITGDDDIVELPDIAYAQGIPEHFIMNGITYDSSYALNGYDVQYVLAVHGGYELDELIGYYVNREDYQQLYETNPNMMYAIDEENTIFNSYDDNKLSIYSLKGHDIEKYVAIYLVDRVVHIYVNNNYDARD